MANTEQISADSTKKNPHPFQPSTVKFSVPKVQKPHIFSDVGKRKCIHEIVRLLKKEQAVLIAHYYTDPDIQKLADKTGGFVGDSLEMARFGNKHPANTLVVAGVYFMGETAKILSPQKRVLMPTLSATCSLDLSCPSDKFKAFCEAYPDRVIVVYANTSASVKACSDWIVTSRIAVDVVEYLSSQNKKILWAPDKYLGQYIQSLTKADMILWEGSCVVHEEFKSRGLEQLKKLYPNAAILVHPESPPAVIDLADIVGSTSRLLQAVKELNNEIFIVATDQGLLYKMQEAAPGRSFIVAPTGGVGATCKSCAHCPWMSMNDLLNLCNALRQPKHHEILIDEKIIESARLPLDKMIKFKSLTR